MKTSRPKAAVTNDSQLKNLGRTLEARAIDAIDDLLAQAFGHGASERILERAAQQINDWAECESWGKGLRERYTHDDHILSRYIKDDIEKLELLRSALEHTGKPGLGHNSRLTADEEDLVVRHWPLVESEAHRIARRDTELHDRLTAIGRAELEKAVRRFDITRNVKFGAFVKMRIRGCMLNYLDRVWNREPKPQAWADDRNKRWFEGMTRAPRSVDWTSTPAPPESRLIPGKHSQSMREAALAKLNPRQQAVWRGRVLRKPPLSRRAIARQLGIADVTQISRIERQALRKMRGLKEP